MALHNNLLSFTIQNVQLNGGWSQQVLGYWQNMARFNVNHAINVQFQYDKATHLPLVSVFAAR